MKHGSAIFSNYICITETVCHSQFNTGLFFPADPEENSESLTWTKLNMWVLLKHCQSIFYIKCSIDPPGSITAGEVLWHQCDRINTSKAESGPTAASHSQYSTFHVLLRFTTISRKPTASQTEKDNGANLLLSGLSSASVKYVKFCVWWKIGVQQAHVRKRCLTVSHGRDAKEHLSLTFKLKVLLRACMVWLFMMQTFDSHYGRKIRPKSFFGDAFDKWWWDRFMSLQNRWVVCNRVLKRTKARDTYKLQAYLSVSEFSLRRF